MTDDNKTIKDLRSHLFSALQELKAGTLDLDRAKAINELSKTLIDSAKVEVDFLRVTNGVTSEFIDSGQQELPPNVRMHRLR